MASYLKSCGHSYTFVSVALGEKPKNYSKAKNIERQRAQQLKDDFIGGDIFYHKNR